jgi:spermidine/putrescine transport system permease protein
MTTVAETLAPPPQHRGTAVERVWRFARYHTLTVFGILALVYLLLPVAIVVLFSFNDTSGKFNYVWEGVTTRWWTNPFGVPGLQDALVTSLKIAGIATVVSTVLGTMVALALVRYRFRARGLTNLLIFLPMTAPEIVLGASLLSLFLNLGARLGLLTILLAHVMFSISFVVVTVKARLVGFDRHLEEAAMDLGANEFVTFQKVTLPLIAPGILAASLHAFALSIDDFVITYFNSGATITFPLFVWGSARVGVPPQVNVIGSMIFFVAVGIMVVNVLWQRRRERQEEAAAS